MRSALTWNDTDGKLWLAWIDRATGLIVPANGKGMLLDPDSMKRDDSQLTKNGPEFALAAGGDVIVTTKFATSKHIARNARISITAPLLPSSSCSYISADGLWCTNHLDANHIRFSPYGSNVDNDPAPRISYVDNDGNHYWREVFNPSTERPIVGMPANNFPVRHVVATTRPSGGAGHRLPDRRRHRHGAGLQATSTSTGAVELTFDAGKKYEVWSGARPSSVTSSLITLVNNTELRIYRNLPDGATTPRPWKAVLSYKAPAGNKIWSPEPFVYQGRSFIFMSHTVRPLSIRTEAWIASVGPRQAASAHHADRAAGPASRPQVFITDRGPLNLLQQVHARILRAPTRGRAGMPSARSACGSPTRA